MASKTKLLPIPRLSLPVLTLESCGAEFPNISPRSLNEPPVDLRMREERRRETGLLAPFAVDGEVGEVGVELRAGGGGWLEELARERKPAPERRRCQTKE